MNTRDLRQEGGQLSGFIISNLLLSRRGAIRVASAIPGVTIVRAQRPLCLSGPDDFCEFVLQGNTFLVIEPFGDNSEYWVVSEPPEDSPQLAAVREAFASHRVLFGALAG